MQFVTLQCTQPSQDSFGYLQTLPLAKAYVYTTGTTTAVQLYEIDGVTPITNPVTADVNGNARFAVADGTYDIQVVDANGNIAPLLQGVQVYDISDFSDAAGIGSMSTGMSAKTASGVWAARTITGTSGQIVVTNGNGVSGNPTLALATGAAASNLGFTPENVANKTTDNTLGGGSPSDALYASEKAVKAYVDNGIAAIGAMVYQGTWNASTNSPTLTSGTGTKGKFYTVSIAGTTTLDGISSWNVGDKAVYNGTAWEKIDGLTNEVVSVSGRTGAVTAAQLVQDIFLGANLPETSVASAATTDLTVSTSPKINITGTTTITAFTVANHALYLLKFAASLTLTYNATSLMLPGEANIVTQAGDCAVMTTDASGNCRIRHYTRAADPLDPPGKNYLVNPSFDVWQEATSYTPSASSQPFVADGWKATRAGPITNYTISRQAGFNGAQYCCRIQRTATTTDTNQVSLGQQILSTVAASLAGQVVTISADVRTGSNYSASLAAGLHIGTGVDETFDLHGHTFATGDVNEGPSLTAPTIAAGQTYTRQWFGSVLLPANTTEIAVFFANLAYSSSAAGANDYIDITNVKLEVGYASTPFEHPALAETMQHCQRRYQSSANQGTAPAQNLGTGTGEHQFAAPLATTGTQRSATIRLDPTMRATPSITLLNPAATNGQVRDETAGGDCSSSTAANVSDHGFNVTCTGNASTAAGNLLGVHWVADCRI